ncbi:hypothetical protein [Streptomyces sp. NPDC046727]|uniref:hypothetical protein n=1 Tax=Streptomyces sp. NPDC046727 TaxID=3155373 RepID=UPI00340555DD
MARHASPRHSTAPRALIALATAGAALGAGAATAHAETGPQLAKVPLRSTSLGNIDPRAGVAGAAEALPHVTGPLTGIRSNPLAGPGPAPLGGGVGPRVGDFAPVGAPLLVAPVAATEALGAAALGILGR